MKRQNSLSKRSSARRRNNSRGKVLAKFNVADDADISYKNITLLQKFINSRGKIVPRRVSGVTAKVQRQLAVSIKRARFLALLTTGGVKK